MSAKATPARDASTGNPAAEGVTRAREEKPGAEASRPTTELTLPAINDSFIPSQWLVRRAFSGLIALVVLLIAGSVLASFFVRMSLVVNAVEPGRIWAVRATESGLVNFLVRAGDSVRAGQVVAQLDTFRQNGEQALLSARRRSQEAELAELRAALPERISQQESRLAAVEAGLIRANAALRMRIAETGQRLDPDSLVVNYRTGGNVMLDNAVSDVQAARADVATQRAALRMIKMDSLALARRALDLDALDEQLVRSRSQLSRFTIVAPASGIVLTDELERRAGAFVQAGEQVVEIAEQEDWALVALVPDREIHDVKVGQAASIEVAALDTLNGRPLTGTVRSVALQPITGPGGGALYRVVVSITPAAELKHFLNLFRRGYTAQVRIVTREGTAASLAVGYAREHLRRVFRDVQP